jgi:hypothetical protein
MWLAHGVFHGMLVSLSFLLAPAVVDARPIAGCAFYRALDKRCGCAGADHYFLQYGERYCTRFMRAVWSPAGVRWRDRTLACLRDELRRHVAASHGRCDCAAIKSFAFDSYARCYTQQAASVCRLPLADLARIYALIDPGDLLDPAGSRQVLAVALSCVRQNGNAGARPDNPTP